MNASTASLKLTGVVPAVCDAEAGQQHSSKSADQTPSKQEFSERKGRTGSEPSRKPQRHIAHVAMD